MIRTRAPRLAGWMEAMRIHPSPTVRGAQRKAITDLSVLSAVSNLLNCLIITLHLQGRGHDLFLFTWAGAVGGLSLLNLWSYFRYRPLKPTASERAIRRTTTFAAVLAGLWGIFAIVMFREVEMAEKVIVGCLLAGTMAGGVFVLSPVPRAAIVYGLVITVCFEIALLRTHAAVFWDLGLLIWIFAAFLIRHALSHGRLFVTKLEAETTLREQNEVIGLLLHDFEETASDWLWETDGEGRIIRFPSALAALPDPPCEFIALLRERFKIGCEDAAQLAAALAAGQPFRDLMFEIRLAGERRVWSLTAKPLPARMVDGLVDGAAGSSSAHHGFRGVGTDVTERVRAEERAALLAATDALTGLPNRRRFHRALGDALSLPDHSFSVLSLDLDRFKEINDTMGHPAGDALLITVARRLLAAVSPGDMVARLGGDEFAILAFSCRTEAQAGALARAIQARFDAPVATDAGDCLTATSIGIVLAPQHGATADDLMKHVDLALYHAKSNGRARYSVFNLGMTEAARRRHDIELGLRRALGQTQLDVHFQPFQSLATGRIAGMEALLRWTRDGEPVNPSEFIPIAEDNGLIVPIGEFVLREALSQAATWPKNTVVAVNCSALQFRNRNLLPTITRALAESGLPAHRLEIEITESLFLDKSDVVLDVLMGLRALGVRIALDDFGTGFSSLSYLRQFPLDKIKIDRSFIVDVTSSKEDRDIIRAIVDLARALSMTTVAEGVETDAQMKILFELGCDIAQGYYIGRPDTADKAAQLFGTAQAPPRASVA